MNKGCEIRTMEKKNLDMIPRAEMRGFIQHLQNRAYAFVTVFTMGFVIGYPISEEIIEWFLSTEGYKPSNVQIIILQPMEVVLLQLQMGTQIGFLLVIFAALDFISSYAGYNLTPFLGPVSTFSPIIFGSIGWLLINLNNEREEH